MVIYLPLPLLPDLAFGEAPTGVAAKQAADLDRSALGDTVAVTATAGVAADATAVSFLADFFGDGVGAAAGALADPLPPFLLSLSPAAVDGVIVAVGDGVLVAVASALDGVIVTTLALLSSLLLLPPLLLGPSSLAFVTTFFSSLAGAVAGDAALSLVSDALPSTGFMAGNNNTSLMLSIPVKNMVRRSIPIPQPAVGGKPYSIAVTKSSSICIESGSPAYLSYHCDHMMLIRCHEYGVEHLNM